jgi:glycosyltransferase involved in cell wall biosynthesis
MVKLSIITSNYNNLEGLQKTLDSVFDQKFIDREYIIIDGGSTDGGKEFIQKHENKLKYWHSYKDKGTYDAMNMGLKMASGLFVQFLNSGDILLGSDCLKRCFSEIDKNDCDIAYGQIEAFWGDEKKVIIYPVPMTLAFLKQYSINHQATFIKRELLNKVGGFDLTYDLAADYALILNCVLRGGKFLPLQFPVVDYDMEGISSKRMKEYIDEMAKAYKNIIPSSIDADIRKLHFFEIHKEGYRKNRFLHYFFNLFANHLQKKEDEFFPHRKDLNY